jgi:hypothetical protein
MLRTHTSPPVRYANGLTPRHHSASNQEISRAIEVGYGLGTFQIWAHYNANGAVDVCEK